MNCFRCGTPKPEGAEIDFGDRGGGYDRGGVAPGGFNDGGYDQGGGGGEAPPAGDDLEARPVEDPPPM